jgi:hypothetical protein
MKPLVVIFSLLSFAVLVPCVSSAGETNAEMNAVIHAVHNDFLILRANCVWLTNYSESCLENVDGHLSIHYMPPYRGTSSIANMRPTPDFISIGWDDINYTNDIQYWNNFGDIAACHFPSLKTKVSGIILNVEDHKLAERLTKVVEMECARLHKQLDQHKSD